ncbi:MAG: hypothetical protein K5695_03885 [Oscillospiraceae bacterium]|nr:hypothetical protein [Oscillospiraceae bacterium]
MFDYSGKKMKVLAYILLILCVIGGLVFGILLLKDENWWGLLIIGGAIVGGWINSLILYTIGDISETVDSLAYRLGTMRIEKEE